MTFPSRYLPPTRPLTATLLIALAAGLSVPFIALPPAHAAATPPAGTTELSPTPVNDTTAVAPDIVVTFDDSGSMNDNYMGDNRPFDGKCWDTACTAAGGGSPINSGGAGPWLCAGLIDDSGKSGTLSLHAMNGVYYNPTVTYSPPTKADGSSFPAADKTLVSVWRDGVTANRPLSPSGGTTVNNFTNGSTGSGKNKKTTYWNCPYDGNQMANSNTKSPVSGSGGGPYYYRYTGPALSADNFGNPTATSLKNLYTATNWTAVAVPAAQYQNWANWWAYYRTRNQMTRSALSRAFGKLGATGSDGKSYGSSIRAAWQNLNTSKMSDNTIISELIDTNSPSTCDPTSSKSSDPSLGTQSASPYSTPPPCYRSAFFNWIFSVPASGGTPARAAAIRAGQFYQRGGPDDPNKIAEGDLHDPYWQPPSAVGADGQELVCRQNFHMLVTDGYWNEATSYKTPITPATADTTLPDGTAYSAAAAESRIFWNVRGKSEYTPSQADIAFNFWANDLRSDLYKIALDNGVANPVSPYMPDTTTGVVSGATSAALEQYFNPNNDPANWPHMVEYMVTLGVPGDLAQSDDYDCTDKPDDACSLRTGAKTSDGGTGWPAPQNNDPTGIDDTWHAAVNSRGKYFNAGNPDDLVTQLSNILSNIAARQANPTAAAINASVLSVGALAFNTGYSTADWSGVMTASLIDSNGNVSQTPAWDAGQELTTMSSPATSRLIFTDNMSSTGAISSMTFESGSSFDAVETAGLGPAKAVGSDTQKNRIAYLRGDSSLETENGGIYRKRTSLLGAIINSQPLYISGANSGYTNTWPSGAPEAGSSAQTYDAFVTAEEDRVGTVYVGANDGMLHAFTAPAPQCTTYDSDGNCTKYDYGTNYGQERWAFIPRAVYGNLGNLTSANFKYAPTVDGTPRSRDVFFSDNKWHTLLVGGVGLGGRGVYALDVTDPTASTEAAAATKLKWEFDSDSPVSSGCVSNIGTCRATDLGYTFGTPNIGRLANGKWVVLVSTGYFPDCSKGDQPTPCDSSQAPKDSSKNPYSALFVLDAETGAMIAELKTPTDIAMTGDTGTVTSFGLATPVLGDYNNDQIDDVAFAGDLQGNLWRFDLQNSDPSKWSVALTYEGLTDSSHNQGVQPITVMPRLFPDPTTNRFIVVFGTGKYLGAADNTSTSAATQSVYGVRDELESDGVTPATITHSQLQPDYLFETTVTDSNSPDYGITERGICGNSDASAAKCDAVSAPTSSQGGWYFDLNTTSGGKTTDAGERVVVTAGAIFSTNTAILSTLIPGSSDPCNPSAKGAVMFVDATSGGPGTGQSSLGGYPYVGGRVDNVRTGGSLPVASALGGGTLSIPGLTYSGSKNNKAVTGDTAIWRRRSWQEIEIQQ